MSEGKIVGKVEKSNSDLKNIYETLKNHYFAQVNINYPICFIGISSAIMLLLGD